MSERRDPFEDLARPVEPRRPRPTFARELRARLAAELGLDPEPGPTTVPTVEHPRRTSMTDTPSTAPDESPGRATPGGEPGIWAGLSYRDAPAGIRFLVDVLGFEEQIVVTDPDDPAVVVHGELRWPEGGVVQAGTYVPDNPFMQAPGAQSIYVITRDPHAVWERCRAAGVDVVRPPEEPHYDPGGMGFSIRDPEGNILSFGSYAGGA